jgi:prolipoprotein diacylglyceryltransferase
MAFPVITSYGIFLLIGFFLYGSFLYWLPKSAKVSYQELIDLCIPIYLGAFTGGKLLFFLCHTPFYFLSSFDYTVFFKGFSVLGSSLGGGLMFYWLSVLYNLLDKPLALLPLGICILHAFGRLGCYAVGCCGGTLFGIPLQFVSFFWYIFAFLFSYFSYSQGYCIKAKCGIFYYFVAVFFERLFFDGARFDAIFIFSWFTLYQAISLFLLVVLFFLKQKKIF